ncbi:MAG: hypothetical protein KDD33_09505 [Bdellovibrionales bacterium]|nr:hypothetical protein [Bdellovibrionales bacterium]
MNRLIFLISILSLVIACSPVVDDNNSPPPPEKPSVEQTTKTLFKAIYDEDINAIDILIRDNVDLTQYDETGKTPLMVAILIRNQLIVEKLVTAGSKVYQPEKGGSQTSFDKVHESDKQILSVLNKEKIKISEKLRSLLNDKAYDSALALYKSDFLPGNFILFTEVDPLFMVSSNVSLSDKKEKLKLVDYLLTSRNGMDRNIAKFDKELFKFANATQSPDLFKKTIKLLKSSGSLPLLILNTNELSVYPSEIDPSENSLEWIGEKIKILSETGIPVFPGLSDSNVPQNLIISKSLNGQHESDVQNFINNLLKTTSEDQKLEEYIVKLLQQTMSYSSQDNFNLTKLILTLWNQSEQVARVTTLDDILPSVLSSSTTTHSIETLRPVINELSKFTSKVENKIFESLKAALSSSLSNNSKREVFREIYNIKKKIPDEFFAVVLELNPGFIDYILKNNYSFDGPKQTSSLEYISANFSSGENAKTYLSLLNDNGVPFNNQSGANSLKFALENYYSGKDSFLSVINYLLQHKSKIINHFDDSEIVDVLSNLYVHIGESKKDWHLVSSLLQNLDRTIKKPKRYVKTLLVNSEPYEVNISVVWDYISTIAFLLEDLAVIEDIVPFVVQLEKLLMVFPEEFASLEESTTPLNPDRYLSHSSLGLTLILLSKNTVGLWSESHDVFKNMAIYGPELRIPAYRLSNRLFQYPKSPGIDYDGMYWQKVATILIKHNHKLTSSYLSPLFYLTKNLITDKLLDSVPGLSAILGDIDLNSSPASTKCAYVQTDSPSYAVNVASFNAIIPLYRQLCFNEKLSSSQREFLTIFLKKNFIKSDKETSNEKKSVREAFSYFSGMKAYGGYTQMGVAIDEKPDSLVDTSSGMGHAALNSTVPLNEKIVIVNNSRKEIYHAQYSLMRRMQECAQLMNTDPITSELLADILKDHDNVELTDNQPPLCLWREGYSN